LYDANHTKNEATRRFSRIFAVKKTTRNTRTRRTNTADRAQNLSMHHGHVSVPVSTVSFEWNIQTRLHLHINEKEKRTRGRMSQRFEITATPAMCMVLYLDRRDVAEPLSSYPHPPHSIERCFYMCGPSLCSRLVVKKRFETFTTFFPPAPSTAENAPKVKQGKMEKRVTTFFFSEV
jgi:hypothetical protein